MNIITLSITLLLAIYFVKSKPAKQILILIVAIGCCDVVIVGGFSFSKCPQILALIMFIQRRKEIIKSLKWLNQQPYFKLVYIIIFADVVLVATSPHLRSMWAIASFVIAEILLKYLIIILPLCFIRDIKDIRKLVKPVFYSLVVLCVFGAMQYATHQLLTDTLLGVEFQKNTLDSSSRPRATSLFMSPFDFGYLSILFTLFLIYARNKKWISKNKLYITIFLGCANTLLCGARTVMFCLIAAAIVYFLIRQNIVKNTCYALATIMILIIGYTYLPTIHSMGDLLLSSFDMNSKVEGSSLEMRIKQYTAALYHIRENMLFGRGYRYFLIDLGWAEGGKSTLLDSDLEGLEGVLMNYTLERGFFGVAMYILFYTALLYNAYKYRKKSRYVSASAAATIVVCICYGNMTGELGSTMPTLFMLGIYFKAAYLNTHASASLTTKREYIPDSAKPATKPFPVYPI